MIITDRKYTGIGSRETPLEICTIMTQFASYATELYELYTGYAIGADQAFAKGTTNRTVFNPSSKLNHIAGSVDCTQLDNWPLALEIAERFHPAWNWLKPPHKNLIARNTYQILGLDLVSPTQFVICWTPDGSTGSTSPNTGGTGQAIRIAKAYNVPIFNLQLPDHLQFIDMVMQGILDF